MKALSIYYMSTWSLWGCRVLGARLRFAGSWVKDTSPRLSWDWYWLERDRAKDGPAMSGFRIFFGAGCKV